MREHLQRGVNAAIKKPAASAGFFMAVKGRAYLSGYALCSYVIVNGLLMMNHDGISFMTPI